MKSKSDQRLVRLEVFLYLEVEHPQQLTSEIFIVPHSYRTVVMTASSDQWSLLAYVHSGYTLVVEALVNVLEDYLFLGEVVYEVRNLGDQLVYV